MVVRRDKKAAAADGISLLYLYDDGIQMELEL
jgi:hypothetical protein